MAKRARPKTAAVKVYLHPNFRRDYYMNGTVIRNPRNTNGPAGALETFMIPLASYERDQAKVQKDIADGVPPSPQFVRVDEPTTVAPESLDDQKVGKQDNAADRGTMIMQAWRNLDHSDDSQWNKDDTPSIRYLERELGFDITKTELAGLVGDIRRYTEDEDEVEDDGGEE